MIYINQLGHETLGWGNTKEEAFECASLMFPDLRWEEISDLASTFGQCYWSYTPNDEV